jgi:hypothetical protein
MSVKVSSIVRKTLNQAMKTRTGLDFMKYLKVNKRTNEVFDFKNSDKVETLNAFDLAFESYASLIQFTYDEDNSPQFKNWKKEIKNIIEEGKKKVTAQSAIPRASTSGPKSFSTQFLQPTSVPKKVVSSSKDPITSHLQPSKQNVMDEGISESSRKERLDQLSTIENIFFENSCNFNSYLDSNQTTREKISRLPPRLFLDEILKMSNNLWFCGDISSDTVEYIKTLLSSVHSKVEVQSNLDSKIIKNIDDYLKNNSFSQFLNSEFCNYGENALSEYLALYIAAYQLELDRDVLKELSNLYEALIKKEIRESPYKGILTSSESESSKKNKFMFTNSPFILPKVTSPHKISSKTSKSRKSGKSEFDFLQPKFRNLQLKSNSTTKDKFGDLPPECMGKTKTSNRVVLYNDKPLELINVLGDGSCFYHSIAHILRKVSRANGDYSQVTGHELRKQFVNYLGQTLTDSLLTNKEFAVNYIFDTSIARDASSDSRQILKNLHKLLRISDDNLGNRRLILQAINTYLENATFEKIENLVQILLGSIRNIGNYFNEIQVIPFANFLKQIGTLQNFQTTIDGYIVLNVTSRRVASADGFRTVTANGMSTYPIANRDDNRIMVYLNTAPHYNAVKKVGTGDFNNYIFNARKSNWSRDLVEGTNIDHLFF